MGQITQREAGIFSCMERRADSGRSPNSGVAGLAQKILAAVKGQRALLEKQLLRAISDGSLDAESISRIVAELAKSAPLPLSQQPCNRQTKISSKWIAEFREKE